MKSRYGDICVAVRLLINRYDVRAERYRGNALDLYRGVRDRTFGSPIRFRRVELHRAQLTQARHASNDARIAVREKGATVSLSRRGT